MKKAILITILCLMSSLVSAGEDTSSKEVSLDYKIAKQIQDYVVEFCEKENRTNDHVLDCVVEELAHMIKLLEKEKIVVKE